MTEEIENETRPRPSLGGDGGAAAAPALVLVSTPIGNLKDFSVRARESLEGADAVLCEDTRTSGILMQAYGIKTRLIALHEHNEEARTPQLIAAMQGGAHYALISDAGTPLISDPGYRLTRAAIEAGLLVSAVPGANAAVLALTLSGLPPHPFLFFGFLPPKSGPRRAALTRLRDAEAAGLSCTFVFHEAPHRLVESLQDAAEILGQRSAAVCRELSKRYEEVRRGTLQALAAHFEETAPRGEITMVIGPAQEQAASTEDLDAALQAAMTRFSLKDAVDAVAAATGTARKQVYARALALHRSESD